ncbi:hypothetical protein [Burkholderia anthina]|uniref:hypothetical protein n=1 Tax=Burkholderia anthina TaxID=179879 RepID=UPI001589FDA3|nr:hypothetical protein [Burkholderia anthina]
MIITDYPDFSDDARFQAAFCERWRDGLKLVPDDWPAAQAVGLVCHCGAPGFHALAQVIERHVTGEATFVTPI